MAKKSKHIYQFRALAALERAFAADPGVARAALDRLREPLDLTAPTAVGLENHLEKGTEDPFQHLQDHWLSGVYFPKIKGDVITKELAAGFKAAIEAAAETGKALIPVWVCASEDPKSSAFRVDHVETATAIVVAIMTPKPATR
jgi:hypothetical protein